MTSSLTISLEEIKREKGVLKADNKQLRTSNDAMKDEIMLLKSNNDQQKDEITQLKAKQRNETEQLTTLLDKMAVNNQNQRQQIYSQSSKIAQLTTENQQLKVG